MGILTEEGIPGTCHVLGYGLFLSEERIVDNRDNNQTLVILINKTLINMVRKSVHCS